MSETSRAEQYLQAIASGTGAEGLPEPQSRLEEIFRAMATGDATRCPEPQSRLEAYALACVGAGGGGGSGGDSNFAEWIAGNRTVLYEPAATKVCDSFARGSGTGSTSANTSLTSVDLPNVTQVGSYAFQGCANLKSINMPMLTTLGIRAFENCTSLQGDLYFPELTTINWTSASSTPVFTGSAIRSIEAPKLAGKLGALCFSNCTALEEAILPSINGMVDSNSASMGAFYNCSALKKVDVRNCTGVGTKALEGCTSLECLDALGGVSSPSLNAAILALPSLRVVSIRAPKNVATLGAVPTTGNYATGGAGGYFIVPSATLTKYKSATNYSAMFEAGTCAFVALEDYTVDGTTTGGLDWGKVDALIGG